jgi:hypothetical protein
MPKGISDPLCLSKFKELGQGSVGILVHAMYFTEDISDLFLLFLYN